MALNIRMGLALQIGNRTSQQDAVVTVRNGGCVADGMGGHSGGEVASRICVETFSEVATSNGGPSTIAAARAVANGSIERANLAIFARANAEPILHGMGSTMAAVLVVDNTLIGASVGDSRIYHYCEGTLRQLSEDHSVAGDLVRAGTITAEAARTSRWQHVLTRVCGGPNETAECGDEIEQPLQTGDRILVCTDGIDKHLDDTQIAALIASSDDPQVVADALVKAALDGGGSDNIGVLVLFVS